MMKDKQQILADHFETLVQNAQKGEFFLVKLKDNPVVYTAIPLIHYSMDTGDDTMFVMKVTEPSEHQGVYQESVENIEFMERKGVS